MGLLYVRGEPIHDDDAELIARRWARAEREERPALGLFTESDDRAEVHRSLSYEVRMAAQARAAKSTN